ncbi:MAG: PAS-domain containing protein [Lysobacteraceae bacterium]
MLNHAVVIVAGLIWLGLLFGAAVWGERRGGRFASHWGGVYALSLAVYCTSWTFYGTVTQAARSGWPLPPTFVGTILLYVFGLGLVRKLVRLARESDASSLADLIATRISRSSGLAAAITFVALLGLVPYISLQLKAVTMSFNVLTRGTGLSDASPWQDSALYVALAMALFAMLFGTRRASAAEHNPGLVLAMAMEALLKLLAMLALGVFIVFFYDGPVASITPQPGGADGFAPLIVLGVLAMFTLPHQFHVGVVECRDEKHLFTARWMFPLYMVLIALPLLPLARAGQARLEAIGVPSDLYVLALPLAEGHDALALLAFLGGLSAATGMVILATISLSLMIGNHWLAPLRVRGAWAQPGGRSRRGEVLLQRRFAILAVVLLAWGYSRAIAGSEVLADIGAVSFSALATIAPALGFALWRPRTAPFAVVAGLAIAVLVWAWALLVPTLAPLWNGDGAWLTEGPFGIAPLAPDALFGLSGWTRLGRAVVFSLLAGALVPLLLDRHTRTAQRGATGSIDVAALRDLAARFLNAERVERIFTGTKSEGSAPAVLQQQVERDLAAVLGAASARLLIDAARTDAGPGLETVANIVGDASQASRFNQQLLEGALENMSQGISVVDRDLKLVAWNRRYTQMFGFPSDLLQIGQPIEALARWSLQHGFGASPDNIEDALQRRLHHMRAGTPHLTQRRFPDGSIVEVRGNPLPDGGFVATFTDVTQFRRAEAELKLANETLEQRVVQRTAELERARHAAEQMSQSRMRFLAAVSHDLLQPMHAAQLFVHALAERLEHEQYRDLVENTRSALASGESLLGSLPEMSRLDAGKLKPEVSDFALARLIEPLAAEFSVLAAERGIELSVVQSRRFVRSDMQLLRRILMNFLSNALRYTERGRVLLGARLAGTRLRLEVWDTGPGIVEPERAMIFDEFRRGTAARGQGLGLGLSIAERMAALLDHPLTLRSWPGRGSVFAVEVPLAPTPVNEAISPPIEPAPTVLPGERTGTALVLDNDPAVRQAMRELLHGWGWQVHLAADLQQAREHIAGQMPDLLLLDYHLDDGCTGLQAWRVLGLDVPAIVITADRSEAVKQEIESLGLLLLYKPLRPLALRSSLRRIVAG